MNIGTFLSRRRVALGWVFGAAFFLLSSPRPGSVGIGLVLMAAGAGLRTWASGHIRKQEKLAIAGPYAFTRNPLYLGSFLMAGGALIMGRSWLLAVAFLLLFVPVYRTVMMREESVLEGKFAGDFLRYRDDVPLFFPRLSPYAHRPERFDWALVRKHREWRVWLGVTGVTLLLLGKYYWL